MKLHQNAEHHRPHVEIRQPATELQNVISQGEELLDRIHALAHAIEEHVHQALSAPERSSG